MKRPRNTSTTPHGNWNLTLPNGVKCESNHSGSFMGKVRKALEGNELDVRGWEDWAWDEACKQNPNWDCIDTEVEEKGTTVQDVWRAARSAMKWAANGGKMVDQEEADRRADICVSCHRHGAVTGCAGCRSFANWGFEMLANKHTKHDDKLTQCKTCRCELKIKVWLPLGAIADQDMDGSYPNFCWAKSEMP